MMGKQMRNGLKIWVYSLCFVLLVGCNLTLGPIVENKIIIVEPGVPIEILENKELDCRVLTDKDGETNVVKQDVGGWVAMPPAHWDTFKKRFKELQDKTDNIKGID